MHKVFTLLLMLCFTLQLHAQDASVDFDFSDPAHGDKFNFIFDSGGELQKTVANGEMKLVLNKQEWHFFQVWVSPFDFINNPYISFRVKGDQPTPIRMWLKDINGAELTVFEATVPQSDEYITYAYAVENFGAITTHIQEIGIDVGGYQVPPATFAGTFYFDDFKMGQVVKPNTSLDLQFSDAADADKLNYIFDTGGELTKTVEEGAVKLVLNKKEWHFFQVWVSPFDFIKFPYLSMRIKVEQATPLRIWVNQPGVGEKELYNGVLTPSDDYQTIQLKIDNVAPLTGYIQELAMDIGGYQVPPASFAGTVYIDELRLGEVAIPPTEVYGTSHEEDFSAPLFSGWASGEGIALSQENDALRINVSRDTPIPDGELGKLPSLSFGEEVIDISANPFINLDIKANDPFTFSVIAVDNRNQWKEFTTRVTKVEGYQTVSLDLSSIPGIDLSKIERFYLAFNRLGFAFRTIVWIDNISIGDAAGNLPVMDAIDEKVYYRNTGNKEILLTHIKNASAVTVTSAPSFIENVTVTPISNGTATLKFKLKVGQVGEGLVTLNVQGNEGYGVNTYSFNIKVEDNLAPTIDAIADTIADTHVPLEIQLTGLSDGNVTREQPLTFVVTSSNSKLITGKVIYDGESQEAVLQLMPHKKGNATVTVTVKDNSGGNKNATVTFNVAIYEHLNGKPEIDEVADMEVYQDAGASTLTLTGIGDGDPSKQPITITATSSAPEIVGNVSVTYKTHAATAILHYTPGADTTGTSTITVTLTDNGGKPSNQGNAVTVLTFDISVLQRPVTGYVATLDRSIEGFNGNEKYEITEVDSAGFKALVFKATDKFYWDGVTMNLPKELDLSEHPYVTMEIYPIGQNTLHWLWLFDANGMRNDFSNIAEAKWATAGQWNKVVFDFSGENEWNNGTLGGPINNKRITSILFDMHNSYFSWPPPPNYTGTFLIRNLRIGSEADYTPTLVVSINEPADQVNFVGATNQTVTITGISDGAEGTNVSLTLTNSNPAVVINPVLSAVSEEGTATLTYNTGATEGESTITITAQSGTATSAEISFVVKTLSESPEDAAVVSVNLDTRHQRMYGIGTFDMSPSNVDFYTTEMGASAMRLGIINNWWEPVNDNDDPNVLNMEAFNYGAFEWDKLKELKAKGVESFILTSWSPPAWMKTNLSVDYFRPGYTLDTDNTDNRLDYSMYEEFAESMVAVVKAFKQKADIDLLAIGLQNEPAFHEPYPSAILGPERFVELIKVVGRRFQSEGITTRLYMPEQVSMFVADNNAYLDALQADPEANQYSDIFAIHGYGSDGITPGQPNYSEWVNYKNNASEGSNPKDIWMTETHKDFTSFEDALSLAGAIYGALEYGNVSLWTQWAFEGPFVSQAQPTPMLYTMANFAKFIKPGDVRVTSTSSNEDVLATSFIDEETGKTSVVVINKGDVPLSVKIQGEGLGNTWEMFNTADGRNLERVDGQRDSVFLLPAKSVTSLLGSSTLSEQSAVANTNANARTSDKNSLSVYPNPSKGVFHLGSAVEVQRVEIVDFFGNMKQRTDLRGGESTVSVSGLKPGIYIVNIYTKDGNRRERIVIE